MQCVDTFADFDQATILGFTFKEGQLEIIGAVLDPDVKRLIISAFTQYGKTQAVAVGILCDILENYNKKYAFIAPTIKQTGIIRNYVAKIISETPELCTLVDDPTHRGPEHLKKEMSKERLTFKNGCEILTLTAYGTEGGADPGAQLMGFGADVIVLDEACLILDEIYRKRIKRMLGSNPRAKLIILVNPWHKHNFAYRAWKNPRYRKIHIRWQQGVEEDRVTEDFIEEQKEELTPVEFQVLYDSEFPDDCENALIKWDWIEAASKRVIEFTAPKKKAWGLDVAEQGVDRTILTESETDEIQVAILKQTYIKERETIPTANKVSEIVPKKESLNVDSIGVGAGVYSQLKELGHNVNSIRVSEKPTVTPERFENLKAQRWWFLRRLFEEGLISIPNEPKLKSQLSQMRYEITSKGKIRIIDPSGKSPDYGDSCMLTLIVREGKRRPKIGG